MIIDNETIMGYLIHEYDNGRVALCRILNEYDSKDKEDANYDFAALITNNVTDEKILEKYSKKDIFNL